jgi:hypothetical protein
MTFTHKPINVKEKALTINLDNTIYGSFAEIGAGQDTASQFFKAGGASGTIAKTMSAYDMAFSDAIYGPEESGRYVCQPRLQKMLDKEYGLLVKRLPHRAESTRFFAFANTVEALNFRRTNQGRGWLGVKFQLKPNSEPNTCVIHVELKDNDPVTQQTTLGIMGVNLIYACFYHSENPENLMNSLFDEMNIHKVEIDFFELVGPDFTDVDNRLYSLKLVKNGLSKATTFGPDGKVYMPGDILYKKNILVSRGRFRPVTKVNLDMMRKSYRVFIQEPEVEEENVLELAELTLSNLFLHDQGNIDEQDFMDRVDLLCSLGKTVLISNYQEYFKLIGYLHRFTRKKLLGINMGIMNLESVFEERYYEGLKGGILEAFGTLLGSNTKIYVYPSFKPGTNKMHTTGTVQFPMHLQSLFNYFVENDKIIQLKGVDTKYFHIISEEVLAAIGMGDENWPSMVPEEVAKAIKAKKLFGHQSEEASDNHTKEEHKEEATAK